MKRRYASAIYGRSGWRPAAHTESALPTREAWRERRRSALPVSGKGAGRDGGKPTPVLAPPTINKALGFTPRTNINIQEQTLDTLFCYPNTDTPQNVAHLYMIVWRFIITDNFYQQNYNKELPPFDEFQAYSIYTRTNGGKSQLGRYWEDKFSSRRSSNGKKNL